MEGLSFHDERREPDSTRSVVRQECLVSVIDTAINNGTEWAVDFLEGELKGLHPDKTQAFLHCGRCATTVCLEKEDGSVKVWPPGCELGNTVS